MTSRVDIQALFLFSGSVVLGHTNTFSFITHARQPNSVLATGLLAAHAFVLLLVLYLLVTLYLNIAFTARALKSTMLPYRTQARHLPVSMPLLSLSPLPSCLPSAGLPTS